MKIRCIIIYYVVVLFHPLYATEIALLTTLDEHRTFLKRAISRAQDGKDVTIISPFISHNAINKDDLSSLFRAAEGRIHVYTDAHLDDGKPHAKKGREILDSTLVDLHIVNRVHTKCVIVGDELIAVGSFNWLSVTRDSDSEWCRAEATTILNGKGALKHITKMRQQISLFEEIDKNDYRNFYDCVFPENASSAFDDMELALSLIENFGHLVKYKNTLASILNKHFVYNLKYCFRLDNAKILLINAVNISGVDEIRIKETVEDFIVNDGNVKNILKLIDLIVGFDHQYALELSERITDYVEEEDYSNRSFISLCEKMNGSENIILKGTAKRLLQYREDNAAQWGWMIKH